MKILSGYKNLTQTFNFNQNMSEVEFLNLSNNRFSKPPTRLTYLSNLKTLYMSDTDVETIEKELLAELVNLTELHLNNNIIRNIEANAFI